MLCVKCGKKNDQDQQYCSYCNARLTVSYENEDLEFRENELAYNPSDFDNEERRWRDFVGKNYTYYKFKWLKGDHPERALTWNWAAFFLTIFWLGYRKMYQPLIIILGLYLAVDVIEVMSEFHPVASAIVDYAGIGASVFLGMFGNALYYRHAKKQIAKTEERYPGKRMQINRGGTSGKGVFAAIGGFVVYGLIAFGFLMFLTRGMILFGPNQRALDRGDYSNQFEHYDTIFYEANFGGRAETDSVDVFLYLEDELYAYFEQEVEPGWFGYSGLLMTPYSDYYEIILEPVSEHVIEFEPGNYEVQIFRDDELLSEGSFELEPS